MRMSKRPGLQMATCGLTQVPKHSKPYRKSAGSMEVHRLVAAATTTPWQLATPSISDSMVAKIELDIPAPSDGGVITPTVLHKVYSPIELSSPRAARVPTSASSSSKKTMHGAAVRA